MNCQGEQPGLVVKAEDSRSRGHGFESRHRILDELKENGENKGSQMGQTKKIYLKKTMNCHAFPFIWELSKIE